MASVEDCERALHALVARVAELDPAVLDRHVVARSVSCRVPDLGVLFVARVAPGGLHDLRCERDGSGEAPAQVRLTAASDDLLALL